MSENIIKPETGQKNPEAQGQRVVTARSPKAEKSRFKKRRQGKDFRGETQEFEQALIDLARVTRVMAGGKRMRFRACVAIGNRRDKVGLGLAKGADVTLAINKAVNQAKKKMLTVPVVNGTIPHEVLQKFGAARILLKPAKPGSGVICGGIVSLIVELAGIKNITGKILGTSNKVTNAKCVMIALQQLRTKKRNS